MERSGLDVRLFLILILCLSIELSQAIPIVEVVGGVEPSSGNSTDGAGPQPDADICILSGDLDYNGQKKLVQECNTLDQFTPSDPPQIELVYGSSIVVCCPKEAALTFPIEEQQGDYGEDYSFEQKSEMNLDCGKIVNGSNCIPINQCGDADFILDEPPKVCGSTEDGVDKVCCTDASPPNRRPQSRKYGNKNYDCEDMSDICSTYIKKYPDACRPDHKFFDFMRTACMKTCNRCGNEGCVDEFESCGDWSRRQNCISNSEFMFFHCRESCGSCGFRYPLNGDTQIVNGKDYSDISSDQFFCGEGKLKKDISNRAEAGRTEKDQLSQPRIQKRQLADADDSTDPVSPSEPVDPQESSSNPQNFTFFGYANEGDGINCGSTIINDQFFVFAAHCQNGFASDGFDKISTIILRDGLPKKEFIEVRRLFVNPYFEYPKLYYDIAVGELGRRIIYDYDEFGDTPACLSKGVSIEGQVAVTQGYGFTEKKVLSNVLLEANVTVIDSKLCDAWLRHNISEDRIVQAGINAQLNAGIVAHLMCSKGIYNETDDAYSGPCPGDSGGPLYFNHGTKPDRKLKTLEGIVSGGISCGKNTPTWYTRVSSFRPWIECIIKNAKAKLSKHKVTTACAHLANVGGPVRRG